MTRVAILGGGISGLSAAWYLHCAGIEFVLHEAQPRLGGVIRTERCDGFLMEAGPDSFLSAKPWASDLARELGIADQLIGSNDDRRITYVLVGGRLVPIPAGMQWMVPAATFPVLVSPLFSLATKARMAGEFLFPPAPLPANKDESVASFVARHFGEEIVERLAAPMLAGVYGGDARQLSARAVLPAMVEMEARHRSLVRGLRYECRANTAPQQPIFTSFREGMQQFVEAITARLPTGVAHISSLATQLHRRGPEWRLTTPGGTEVFTHVIVALPAHAAAALVQPFDAALAARLDEIRYASSVVVTLGYDQRALTGSNQELPPGFGFLVPRNEGRATFACTFVHNKFSGRAPEGRYLLRTFLASSAGHNDEEVIATVKNDLDEILGLRAEPLFARVTRWSRSMPQYEVGHPERVAAITHLARQHPGLILIGSAYRGVGIPDCVREGKVAAALVSAVAAS